MAKKLTRAVIKQREAIALDVIAQLKAEKFLAQTGTYANLSCEDYAKLLEVTNDGKNKKVDLQTIAKKAECTVCALGACFMSSVRLTNAVSAAEAFSDKDYDGGREPVNNVNRDLMRRKLNQFFNKREQGAIEAFFEGESSFIGGQSTDHEALPQWAHKDRAEFDKWDRLASLLHENLDDNDRLTLLMQATADLADVRINIYNLRDWFYMELPVNKLLVAYRDEFGI